MKLRNHQFSIQPRIFEGSEYVHPWYQYNYNNISLVEYYGKNSLQLNRPNPPSKEAVERARFIDKTYEWRGRTNSIRPRD
jgi:hypothetical protein